jgi:hypothetical protein
LEHDFPRPRVDADRGQNPPIAAALPSANPSLLTIPVPRRDCSTLSIKGTMVEKNISWMIPEFPDMSNKWGTHESCQHLSGLTNLETAGSPQSNKPRLNSQLHCLLVATHPRPKNGR